MTRSFWRAWNRRALIFTSANQCWVTCQSTARGKSLKYRNTFTGSSIHISVLPSPQLTGNLLLQVMNTLKSSVSKENIFFLQLLSNVYCKNTKITNFRGCVTFVVLVWILPWGQGRTQLIFHNEIKTPQLSIFLIHVHFTPRT